ncbi:MAG: hypothetical protein CBB97_14795 [Candidatus Endolissoclinum sp. TMED37]|nr:MAG: hypothetical protein CBB97_14795 [Candidatus Endolissoclinum sp. TMED37]
MSAYGVPYTYVPNVIYNEDGTSNDYWYKNSIEEIKKDDRCMSVLKKAIPETKTDILFIKQNAIDIILEQVPEELKKRLQRLMKSGVQDLMIPDGLRKENIKVFEDLLKQFNDHFFVEEYITRIGRPAEYEFNLHKFERCSQIDYLVRDNLVVATVEYYVENDAVDIHNVIVHPRYRGQGICQNLIRSLITRTAKKTYNLLNAGGIASYKCYKKVFDEFDYVCFCGIDGDLPTPTCPSIEEAKNDDSCVDRGALKFIKRPRSRGAQFASLFRAVASRADGS